MPQINSFLSNRFKPSFFILPLLFSSLGTFANNAEPSLESGESQSEINHGFAPHFYIGGKVGNNRYQDVCEAWHVGCEHDDLGFGVFGGYQFHDYFALELSYLDLGNAEASYLETGLEQTYVGTMNGIDFSVVGITNLSENFSAFAKLGSINWYGENKSYHGKIKGNGWAPSAGVGLGYQISKSWQARLEYQYFHELGNNKLGSSDAHFTSIGIAYLFGSVKPSPVRKAEQKVVPVQNQSVEPTTIKEVTPIAAPVVLVERKVTSVLFPFDSSESTNPEELGVFVSSLTQYPDAKVSLKGYTDSKGENEYNLKLSEKRVNSVKNYLIEQGVNPEQIESEFFGERFPVVDNLSENTRRQNRRVVVYLKELKASQPQSTTNKEQ